MGWTLITLSADCCVGEILLCSLVLSWMGEKLPVSFVTAAVGALGAAQLPSPEVQPCLSLSSAL